MNSFYRRMISIVMLVIFVVGCFGCTAAEVRNADQVAVPKSEAININTASQAELMRIPYIGEKVAEELVRFRETNGLFRRPEQLLLIDGISDSRFRDIRHLIRTD